MLVKAVPAHILAPPLLSRCSISELLFLHSGVTLYTMLVINILASGPGSRARNHLKGFNTKCLCVLDFLHSRRTCESFICI